MEITARWLGHAAWQFSFDGKTLLVDPWIDNPKAPKDATPASVDYMLITHGHGDHLGNTVALGQKFPNAKIVSNFEISQYLIGKKLPENNLIGMNKGGTVDLGNGLSVVMTSADHSSGCPGENGVVEGGSASGYVIEFHNGPKIYHAGDTNVFSDMSIISELYNPTIACLPIGGHFTMSPREAGYAINKFLSSVNTVLPMHYGTFPILTGTPDQLKTHITRKGVEIKALNAGEKITLH